MPFTRNSVWVQSASCAHHKLKAARGIGRRVKEICWKTHCARVRLSYNKWITTSEAQVGTMFRTFHLKSIVYSLGVLFWAMAAGLPAHAADISPFVGDYVGSANVVDDDGTETPRDMSVSIEKSKHGFNVSWTTTTYKADGRIKEQKFSVDFKESNRPDVFSAAMKRNVFGHEVPLDPMQGEPFVWGRIEGDTLTVFSLFIDETGDYELQQYDRTLAEGGLDLSFSRFRNGTKSRSVETFLKKN
ncbi:hypothetical protein [Ruegeria atlantica]|uniref:hypothetical protein n=1 Tax=Ruegeria atlantica TaxID=81569 RepID=UPI0020C5B07D|nr:hypothetical protein [Ruegeria atlantica]